VGIDPVSNHAPPPKPLRYGSGKSGPLTVSELTSAPPNPKKWSADESYPISQRTTKKLKKKPASPRALDGDASIQIKEDWGGSTPEPETRCQVDPAVQACCYLLEMFSIPPLRSHATISLVDRRRLQLYHATHSVTFISPVIDILKGDGVDKFIANVRYSARQQAVMQKRKQLNFLGNESHV